jgi:ABC-2 type transport system permease protein
MRKLAAIAMKELKIITRDPIGVFMLFVLPAIFILVLSVALQGAFSSGNKDERFTVLVVNEDPGRIGRKLIEVIEDTGRFRVITRDGDKALTSAAAVDLLRRGAHRIAIRIPEHAEEALLFERDETIEIWTDPVLSNEVAYAITHAIKNFTNLLIVESLFVKDRITADNYEKYIDRESPVYRNATGVSTADPGAFSDQFQSQSTNYAEDRGLLVAQSYVARKGKAVFPNEVQQNVPGWTVFALFWIAQMLALNLVTERETGTYKRILVSPVGLPFYILGKTAPFLVVNLFQAAFMFSIGVYVLPLFGCHELVITNVTALAVITVAISLVSIGFGLFMASLSRSSSIVASASAAVLIIMCVIGGVMVPKFIMPAFMQKLSLFVPQGWAVDAYQNVLVRSYDTLDVMPQVGVLLGFAAFFFIFGMVRLNRLAKTA